MPPWCELQGTMHTLLAVELLVPWHEGVPDRIRRWDAQWHGSHAYATGRCTSFVNLFFSKNKYKLSTLHHPAVTLLFYFDLTLLALFCSSSHLFFPAIYRGEMSDQSKVVIIYEKKKSAVYVHDLSPRMDPISAQVNSTANTVRITKLLFKLDHSTRSRYGLTMDV